MTNLHDNQHPEAYTEPVRSRQSATIAPSDALQTTGKTCGEWSAAWWQYVFSFSNPTSPSPIFQVVLPAKNILGVPAGPATSMRDGFYLMLRPLTSGQHTIHFHGRLPAANFALDVTYAPLTVI